MTPKVKTVDRDRYLASCCAGKRVIDIGCTGTRLRDLYDGSLPYDVVHASACKVVGVDSDGDRLAVMEDRGRTGLLCSSHYGIQEITKPGEFDVILCCDVLPRIQNCHKFLNSVQQICTQDTKLILTTPNAHALTSWLQSIFGFDSTDREDVATYSTSTLRRLLLFSGFVADLWFVASSKRGGLVSPLVAGLTRLVPGLGDTLIAECRKITDAEDMGVGCPLKIAA